MERTGGPMLRRVLYLLRRRRHDAELREELDFHRDESRRRLESAGLNRDEAARASRRAMGNVRAAEEDAAGVWTGGLDDVWRDVKYGERLMRRNAGVSTIVIGTLGLGIGTAATAVSLMNAQVWRP